MLQIEESSILFHPDPDDYVGGSFDVTIPTGTVQVTVPVNTTQDIFVEPDEYFSATLSLPGAPDAVVVGTPDVAFVTITDDTGMFGISTSCTS